MIPEEKQNQAAFYALGLLEGEEARALEGEMERDEELRTLMREFSNSAAQLAFLAPAESPPALLRHRVLSAVAEQEPIKSRQSPNWLPWALAAALALTCAGLVWREAGLRSARDRAVNGRAQLEAEHGELIAQRARLEQEQGGSEQERARLQGERDRLASDRDRLEKERESLLADRTRLEEELAALRTANPFSEADLYVLKSASLGTIRAKAIVAWEPSRQSGFIRISNMPAANRGRDYQLWAVDANHKDPVSAGVLHVNTGGAAQMRFKLVDEARQVKAFAISVEREGGVEKKQGPIVMLGSG